MTWHTARVRMWNMRTPMQKLGFPLYIYIYIYIFNHIGKTFHNISSPTIFYNSYLTRIPWPLFTTPGWSLSQPVTMPQSTACGTEMRRGKPWIGVNCIIGDNIYSANWQIFFQLVKNIHFKWHTVNDVNRINILLLIVYFACGRPGSSNRNASRDASVEGDDEFIKSGGETPRSCYNDGLATPLLILRHL